MNRCFTAKQKKHLYVRGGAPEGNQNARVDDENKRANGPLVSAEDSGNGKARKGSNSKDRIIARLKRDAQTNDQARELLDNLKAGDISARKAALDMSYIKPADPAKIVEKQIDNLTPAEVVEIHSELSRRLPEKTFDHYSSAVESFLSLSEDEVDRFLSWVNEMYAPTDRVGNG